MDIDEDILIIQDINRPKQPTEDPLEICQYNKKELKYLDNNIVKSKNYSKNIINLDTSDDETPTTVTYNNHSYGTFVYEKAQTAIKNTSTGTRNKFGTCLGNKKNKVVPISHSHHNLADKSLKSDMYNQLSTTNELFHNENGKDIPDKNNLTNLSKIIHIQGQPSLIENSSGLIFRADTLPILTNSEKIDNVENEMDLYRNFLKRTDQDMQGSNQNIFIKNIFIENEFTTDTSTVNKRYVPVKQSVSQTKISPWEPLYQIQPSIINNISGKKTQLIQSKSQYIRKQPQEVPKGTVLDLNLNINNTRSVANSINSISPSQSTMILPNDSTGRYNLALGLVLNVNDKPNSVYQASPQNQFSNSNNVALDVSFNVIDKGKSATKSSPQIRQGVLPQYYQLPILNRDDQEDVRGTTAGNSYCCGLCLFKTTDLHLIQTHLCPTLPSTCHKRGIYKKVDNLYCCNLCMFKTIDFPVMKAHKCLHYKERGQCLSLNSIEKIFCCEACTFQTSDLTVMDLHVCNSTKKDLIHKIDTPFRNKNSKCVETPAQKLSKGSEIHGNKTVQTNSLEASLEEIYCCVTCTFQISDFKAMKSHVCPSDNLSANIVNIEPNRGLEHINTTDQNSLIKLNYQNKGIDKVYNCRSCTLETADVKIINDHKCSSVTSIAKKDSASKQITYKHKVTTGNQVSRSQQAEFYYCISCSFKTENVSLVQSHRCRGSKTSKAPSKVAPVQPVVIFNKPTVQGLEKISNIQTRLNNIDDLLESSVLRKEVFICEICKQQFTRKYLLFHHLRYIHFGVRTTTIFGCQFCNYFAGNIEALLHHLQGSHCTTGENEKVICKEVYTCTACNIQTDTFQNITMHFDAHIKSYKSIIKISYQQDPSRKRQQKSATTDNTYECILCGKDSDSIISWLTHKCEVKVKESEFSRKRKGQDTLLSLHTVTPGKRTYQGRATKSPKNVCYHCKTQVIGDALKCDSRECNTLYHLKCVEVYGRFMHPQMINRRYNWFCVECTEDSVTFQDDVKSIAWCMGLADKECMLEVEKQQLMVNELNKIKNDNVKMREDFERINFFISNSKTERINNPIVKSVCTIVESFINIGIDTSR